jgi:hypothetical protein
MGVGEPNSAGVPGGVTEAAMGVVVLPGAAVGGETDGSVVEGGADVAARVGTARLAGTGTGPGATQAARSVPTSSHKMDRQRIPTIIMRGPWRLEPAGAQSYDTATVFCPTV